MSVAVDKYFPEINGDLTRVTWLHAVNSVSKLQSALDGMLLMPIYCEAKVCLESLVLQSKEIELTSTFTIPIRTIVGSIFLKTIENSFTVKMP